MLKIFKTSVLKSPSSRFAIKSGLAAGAIYYVSEQGVWRSSVETTKLSEKMRDNLKPYMQEAKSHVPIEIPQLPSTNRVSYLTKQYWNKGVAATFTFLGDLPRTASTWTKKGIETAKGNEEIKKFLDSFSSTPPPLSKAIEPPKK